MERNRNGAGSLWYGLFALTAGCLVAILASRNRLTFPYPWNDEARFFLPSWYFSKTGSLYPKILNAPGGIYWVPDGFYVWMGALLALFGRTIEVARSICEVTVALSVSILAIVLRRITDSSWMGGAITCVLLTPPVIFAANMVRMESVLFLLFAIAMWLHLLEAHTAAVSVLLLSLLFHPALTLALLSYVSALWVTHRNRLRDGHRWQTFTGGLLLLGVLLAFAWSLPGFCRIFNSSSSTWPIRLLVKTRSATGSCWRSRRGLF